MSVLYDNVTIMLQGILHDNIDLAEILTNYTKLCNIVLSIYTFDVDKVNAICKSFPTVTIVINDLEEYKKHPVTLDPEFAHCDTTALQRGHFHRCTTKKGLENINTEYVVKSRVDQYYSGLSKFIEHGIKTPKITTSSIYVRGCKDKVHACRYCLSDCLFMGKTSDIKLCIDLCYNTFLLTRPETGMWKPYIRYIFNQKGIDIDLVDDETYIQYMLNVVDVVCINKMYPYKLKICNRIVTYLHDNDKTTKEYITYGCDC